MTAQLLIVLRDMPHSPALQSCIRRKLSALQRVHERITACRVTLEAPALTRPRINQYCVRLAITMPEVEIVTHDHNDDVHVALRDAFRAARSQLIEHAQRGQRAAGACGSADAQRRP